jgi:hypothetical protein
MDVTAAGPDPSMSDVTAVRAWCPDGSARVASIVAGPFVPSFPDGPARLPAPSLPRPAVPWGGRTGILPGH